MFLLLSSIILAIILFAFLNYVLISIGLMKMAKKAGKDNGWLAWLPIGNWFIMGEIVSEKFKGNGGLKYTLLNLFYFIVAQISTTFALIIAIPIIIINVLVLYWIYKKFTNAATLHTILSFIIPMYMSLCLIINSKNEPNYR